MLLVRAGLRFDRMRGLTKWRRNVMTYEKLLLLNPMVGGCAFTHDISRAGAVLNDITGSALTFSQMLFISLQTMPSFLTFPPKSIIPALKPRQVPLDMWAIQVVVLTSGSLLNNWAYAYKVPLTVLIVFRSAGEFERYPCLVARLTMPPQAYQCPCSLDSSSPSDDMIGDR